MSKPAWWRWIVWMAVMLVSMQASADGWSTFKSRFLQADGRIVDTANNNVSHTEGQGYGMLLAVANNDRPTFELLWNWTQQTLHNPQNDLFYWRYVPDASDKVADKNSASDGDVLIAWALQRAAERWSNPVWQQASDRIQQAIIQHEVVTFAHRTVMLPGVQGFSKEGMVVLNPSYFLFAAWRDFAGHGHQQVWQKLIDDGLTLIGAMHFGQTGLPLDWVALNADGSVVPAAGYDGRFSYDAIRIPLNIWWYDADSPLLAPFQNIWQRYGRLDTPAWFDVVKNAGAPYHLDGGMLAIRDLTLNETGYISDRLTADQHYFSASLQLLTVLALQEAH